ncbi:hypothetical protein [Cohaesibacter celericrescens]|uniref:Uncharacterized protein n=1 Tax=Cohaesibacter celericrescens TaxID=2067669 RepID=A0A2N5XNN9_9HYPH|nr:hypothetical protein [Cohaesibacter celericrescens]PLW76050.1 hypothetical protein C0081_16645 [Cohaesibacter celericrescens]
MFDYRAPAAMCVILLVTALYTFYQEASVFLFQPKDDKSFITAVVQGNLPSPISSFSKSIVLEDCLVSMRSLYARLQPTKQKLVHLKGCRDLALDITDKQPSFSAAWYVAAASSGLLKDKTAFQVYFEKSYQTSTHEDWLSKRRFGLLIRHEDYQSERTQEILRSDISTILNSWNGTIWLAEQYIKHSFLRQLISDLVQLAKPKYQNMFLQQVRKQSQQ